MEPHSIGDKGQNNYKIALEKKKQKCSWVWGCIGGLL